MKKVNTVVILLVVISLPMVSSLALAAQYTFTPFIGVDSYYTDNLFLTPTDKESDIVTTVVPGFTAGVSGRTAGIDVTFYPGYTLYKNNNDLNYWRFNAGLNSFLDITRNTRLNVTDRFYLTRDPNPENLINDVRAGVPGASVDPTVRQGQNKYWRNTIGARVDHQFGSDKSIFAGYRYAILRNDSDLYEDSAVNTGIAGLNYFFGPKWGTAITGIYSRRTYDQTGDFVGVPSNDSDLWGGGVQLIRRFSRATDGYLEYTYSNVKYTGERNFSVVPGLGQPTIVVNEDYQVHGVVAGVNYAIEQDILLTVSAGWILIVNDFTENENGGALNLVLRKTFQRGGLRVQASGGYDISGSQAGNRYVIGGVQAGAGSDVQAGAGSDIGGFDVTAQNLGLTQYYSAGATGDYELFRRFYADIYGAYRHNKYIDTIPEREDDVYLAGAGCTWQPYRWGSIRLGYSYRQTDSEIDANNYTENRILLTIALSTDLQYQSLY